MSNASPERPELSIVMPCLNEAETLAACIIKAQRFLQQSGVHGEVIVADNGSTDGSQAIATRAGAILVHTDRKGYGSALSAGISAANGKYVIMGDSDDSYDFSDLGLLVQKLRDGYDLVMGNRFTGGIKPGAMPPLHRYLGNPLLSGLGRVMFGSPCRDFHCGLRGFNRQAILSLDLRTTGMEYASEMVVKATLRKLKITEVPTVLYPDGRSRPPHLHTWRDGWRHLRFLLLYSPRWLFLYPGVALMLLGGVIGMRLMISPVQVGNVTLDVHTLLYSAMAVLIGFQAVAFAAFTKIFAANSGLLPKDAHYDKIFRYITLEVGLGIGLILLLLGIAGTIYAFVSWSLTSFGNLNPTQMLRIVIPSITNLMLGFQVVLASFFLSVLGMDKR